MADNDGAGWAGNEASALDDRGLGLASLAQGSGGDAAAPAAAGGELGYLDRPAASPWAVTFGGADADNPYRVGVGDILGGQAGKKFAMEHEMRMNAAGTALKVGLERVAAGDTHWFEHPAVQKMYKGLGLDEFAEPMGEVAARNKGTFGSLQALQRLLSGSNNPEDQSAVANYEKTANENPTTMVASNPALAGLVGARQPYAFLENLMNGNSGPVNPYSGAAAPQPNNAPTPTPVGNPPPRITPAIVPLNTSPASRNAAFAEFQKASGVNPNDPNTTPDQLEAVTKAFNDAWKRGPQAPVVKDTSAPKMSQREQRADRLRQALDTVRRSLPGGSSVDIGLFKVGQPAPNLSSTEATPESVLRGQGFDPVTAQSIPGLVDWAAKEAFRRNAEQKGVVAQSTAEGRAKGTPLSEDQLKYFGLPGKTHGHPTTATDIPENSIGLGDADRKELGGWNVAIQQGKLLQDLHSQLRSKYRGQGLLNRIARDVDFAYKAASNDPLVGQYMAAVSVIGLAEGRISTGTSRMSNEVFHGLQEEVPRLTDSEKTAAAKTETLLRRLNLNRQGLLHRVVGSAPQPGTAAPNEANTAPVIAPTNDHPNLQQLREKWAKGK